jgi:hypothetical protein
MSLHLSILPPAQRSLWFELGAVPRKFVLYGGTAIALQLGHRQSIDFDFFCGSNIDAALLMSEVTFLRNAEVVRQAPNTLTCRVDRNGPVMISFLGTPTTRQARSPLDAGLGGARIASLLDLAGTKASVVQQRAEAKDYRDMDALIKSGISLPMALAAANIIFGSRFDPQSTLKALCFFGDGDLESLDFSTRARLIAAVKSCDLDQLPDLATPGSEIGQ